MNKIKKLFKTINKKQARIMSIVFAVALIALVIDLISEIRSGMTLSQLTYSILLTIAVALVEFSMITIALRGSGTEEDSEEDPE